MAGKSRFGPEEVNMEELLTVELLNKPIFLLDGLAGHKMIIRDEALDMK